MTSRPTASKELSDIASAFGGRVKSSNTRVADLSGGPLTRIAQLPGLSRPVSVQSNEEWLVFEVEQDTSLCFAGPVPDRVMGCDRALGTFAGMPIFAPGWLTPTDQLASWLRTHAPPLASLVSTEGERILVAKNKSVFILRPTGVESDVRRLKALLATVGQLPGPPETESPSVLPDRLRELHPLVEAWAMSDDDQRAEAIANASDDQLDALWRSVAPHLQEIDAWLDARADDPGTVHVGDLAQAALEGRHELARRGKAAD